MARGRVELAMQAQQVESTVSGLPGAGVAVFKESTAGDFPSFLRLLCKELECYQYGTCKFQNVEVAGSKLDDTDVAGLIAALMSAGAATVRLKAFRCGFGDEALRLIAKWIESLPAESTPQELHLSHNDITADGFNTLVEVLRKRAAKEWWTAPIWLRLEGNKIDAQRIRDMVVGGRVCLAEGAGCSATFCWMMHPEKHVYLARAPFLHMKYGTKQQIQNEAAAKTVPTVMHASLLSRIRNNEAAATTKHDGGPTIARPPLLSVPMTPPPSRLSTWRLLPPAACGTAPHTPAFPTPKCWSPAAPPGPADAPSQAQVRDPGDPPFKTAAQAPASNETQGKEHSDPWEQAMAQKHADIGTRLLQTQEALLARALEQAQKQARLRMEMQAAVQEQAEVQAKLKARFMELRPMILEAQQAAVEKALGETQGQTQLKMERVVRTQAVEESQAQKQTQAHAQATSPADVSLTSGTGSPSSPNPWHVEGRAPVHTAPTASSAVPETVHEAAQPGNVVEKVETMAQKMARRATAMKHEIEVKDHLEQIRKNLLGSSDASKEVDSLQTNAQQPADASAPASRSPSHKLRRSLSYHATGDPLGHDEDVGSAKGTEQRSRSRGARRARSVDQTYLRSRSPPRRQRDERGTQRSTSMHRGKIIEAGDEHERSTSRHSEVDPNTRAQRERSSSKHLTRDIESKEERDRSISKHGQRENEAGEQRERSTSKQRGNYIDSRMQRERSTSKRQEKEVGVRKQRERSASNRKEQDVQVKKQNERSVSRYHNSNREAKKRCERSASKHQDRDMQARKQHERSMSKHRNADVEATQRRERSTSLYHKKGTEARERCERSTSKCRARHMESRERFDRNSSRERAARNTLMHLERDVRDRRQRERSDSRYFTRDVEARRRERSMSEHRRSDPKGREQAERSQTSRMLAGQSDRLRSQSIQRPGRRRRRKRSSMHQSYRQPLNERSQSDYYRSTNRDSRGGFGGRAHEGRLRRRDQSLRCSKRSPVQRRSELHGRCRSYTPERRMPERRRRTCDRRPSRRRYDDLPRSHRCGGRRRSRGGPESRDRDDFHQRSVRSRSRPGADVQAADRGRRVRSRGGLDGSDEVADGRSVRSPRMLGGGEEVADAGHGLDVGQSSAEESRPQGPEHKGQPSRSGSASTFSTAPSPHRSDDDAAERTPLAGTGGGIAADRIQERVLELFAGIA